MLTVVLSDYVKRFGCNFLYSLIDRIMTFFLFVFSVSVGLALTNAAPCQFFDGDFIVVAILTQFGYPRKSRVTKTVLTISTVLFVINFICGLVSLVL